MLLIGNRLIKVFGRFLTPKNVLRESSNTLRAKTLVVLIDWLFDIGVTYKENVDRVIAVIKELGQEMREDEYYKKIILDDLEMFGVDSFGDSSVNIKFRIKTLPIKQWEVSREFKRRLKNKFDELNIEIPFPHRTLYWGTGEENA